MELNHPNQKTTDLQSAPLPLTVYLRMAEGTGLEPVQQLRFASFQDWCITNYTNPPLVAETGLEPVTFSL